MASDSQLEYVRFAVGGDPSAAERLEALRRAVAGLAAVKSRSPSGQVEPEEEEGLAAYRALLPPMALATFAAEPDEGAWMPPSGLIEPGWDELSMLAAILSGETRLDGVHVDGEGTAELQFTALAWPYGGITCLIRLVEAFGFDVVSYDEGSMPEVSRAQHLEWQRG